MIAIKRLTMLMGVVLALSGCSGSNVGRSDGEDRLMREQRCRELSMSMRSSESADASADISAASLARSNSDYTRYRCSDFDNNR